MFSRIGAREPALSEAISSQAQLARSMPNQRGNGVPSAPPPTRISPPRTPPVAPPPGGDLGLGALRGFAAGLGAWIGYNLPDWIDWLKNGRQLTTLQETDSNCRTEEWAGSYLQNLQRDGIDQGLKAIPPRTFSWDLPSGQSVKVKQGWGKDGLTYTVELKGVDGKTLKVDGVPVRLQATKKGGKFRVAETEWKVAGESFGKFSVDLRIDGKGLNEVELNFTNHRGYVATWKLKPAACNLDLTASRLLRVNQGSQLEAKRWVETYLAEGAVKAGGNLYPPLTDLLIYLQPTLGGIYRNHGSAALDVLTRPLNALRQAGVDMQPLQRIQAEARTLPSDAGRLRELRSAARQWLQSQLADAIGDGRIDAVALRNRFGLNLGVDALVDTAGPAARVVAPSSNLRSETVGDINMREVVRAALPHPVKQTRDGRLFIARTGRDPNFAECLDRVAAVLGVTRQQLVVSPALLTIDGVQLKGVVIEARRFR